MTTHDAAVARLEEQVKHLIAAGERRDKMMERMAEKLDAMEAKLDQSAGGFAVLRWFGFGSLASIIALGSTVYLWLHK
jgi:hypothetical protein